MEIIERMRMDLTELETVVAPPDEPPTGSTIRVKAGEDLQKAIDSAEPGQTLALDPAGAWMTAALRKKSGGGPIRLTTDGAQLKPGRVTADEAQGFAKLGGSAASGLTTDPGAGNYIVDHIRMVPAANASVTSAQLSQGNETNPDDLAHDITLDRMFFETNPSYGQKRGLAGNCDNLIVRRTTFIGFCCSTSVTSDSQAIAIWNARGPFLIDNCYLEGGAENMLVGGADPKIQGLIPSNGVVRHCTMFKPLEWKTKYPGAIKNLFELKNAQGWLVEQNHFENVWTSGQAGRAILFTVRNQNGSAPWCTIQDIMFRRNRVVGVEQDAVNILALDDKPDVVSVRARNIALVQNLFDGVGSGILLNRGMDGLLIDHNTFVGIKGRFLSFNPKGQTFTGLAVTNTIAPSGAYGIHSADYEVGKATLDAYAPGYVWNNNIMERSTSLSRNIRYPSGTRIVPLNTIRDGLDPTTRLPVVSDLQMDGTDGQPIGAPDLSAEVFV
jgi:hypothetical protein